MKRKTLFHRNGVRSAGFTLIEILISMTLGLVILSAVTNLMTTQKQTYEVQAQVTEMEQYVRVGMEQMIREIRMAAFGRPTWAVWNSTSSAYNITYSVQVTQGSGTDPDTIDIVGCLDPASGTFASAKNANSTSLPLGAGQGSLFNTTSNSDIYIEGLVNARVTAVSGDTLTIDTDPATGGNQGYGVAVPTGTAVYILKHHTYAISGGNLTRNENLGGGALELVMNAEDLQATFATPVVTLTLQAMTDREDATYTHPDDGDGYRRRAQTSTIQVRNL